MSLTHEQVQDLLAAYVAEGLSDADRAAVEAHVKLCAACNTTLSDLRQADAALMEVFRSARPDDTMVKRVARGKWSSPWRMNHVKIWRAATAVAAAVLLGSVGYVGTQLVEGAPLPWDGSISQARSADGWQREESAGATRWYGNSNGESTERAKASEGREAEKLGDFNGRAPVDVAEMSKSLMIDSQRRLTEGTATHNAQDLPANAPDVNQPSNFGLSAGTTGGDDQRGRSAGRERSSGRGLRQEGRGAEADVLRLQNAELTGKVTDLEKRLDAVKREYRFGNDQRAQWEAKQTKFQQMDYEGVKVADAGVADRYSFHSSFVTTAGVPGGSTPAKGVTAPGSNVNGPANTSGGVIVLGDGLAADGAIRGDVMRGYFKPAEPGAVAEKPVVAAVTDSERGSKGKGDGKDVALGYIALRSVDVADKTIFADADGDGARDGTLSQASAGRFLRTGLSVANGTGVAAGEEFKLSEKGEGEGSVAEALKTADSKTPEPQNPGQANQGANAQPPPPTKVETPLVQQRKIIRNGDLEFEVDSFDSAFVTVNRIVTEDGGYVQSTNSEKLPNGKVRGTIILRVPPDRLDTLVLKMRALGELKSQKIAAQDITKVYYDLESELRAARAMEERLLNIIKSGKGEIKDLLEAEKQLGTYREKIEKIEGEVRYYNNLVSLSTLTITAFERDIRAAAIVSQTEMVSMGVESDDVEKSRGDALKAIEEAKGRVIESNLKKHDAGQFSATVVADVAPDAAGPLIDRLKQLGKVARLDIDRKQSTEGKVVLPGMKVERKDTRFSISIYNLANIAPRQTSNLNVAVANVEEAYRGILKTVSDRNGRVVASTLNRQKPEQTTASVSFEVPAAEAEAALADLRAQRDVMSMTVTENPDTQNVTASKRGFAVQIYSLATVPPRESEQIVIAVKGKVADAFRSLVTEATRADSRILVSQLNEQEKSGVGGTLDLEVMRGKDLDLKQMIVSLGDVITRSVARSPDAENRVDSKVGLQVRLVSIDNMAPRETQAMSLAASDVPMAYAKLVMALGEANARVITSQLNEQDRRNITGTLDFEVLRTERDKIEKALATTGTLYARTVNRSSDTQSTVDSKVRLSVSIINVAQLPPRESSRLGIIVGDVSAAVKQVQDLAAGVGGRVNDSQLATDASGRVSGTVIIDVPLGVGADVRSRIEQLGEVRVRETATNPGSPEGQIGRAQIAVTLGNREMLVGKEEGLGATLHNALQTSVKGLLVSLKVLIVGLLFVGPWAAIAWFGWKMWKRSRKPATAV